MPLYTSDSSGDFVIGNKEYFSPIIHDISPMTTPLFGMTGGPEILDATTWEYYASSLATPDASDDQMSAQGATISAEDEDRILCQNRTAIFAKAATVSYTQEAVKKVGLNSELDWQAGRRLIQIKQNYETRMINGVRYRSPKTNATASLMQGMAGICGRFSSECQGGSVYGTASPNVIVSIENFASTSPDAMDTMNDLMRHLWDIGAEPDTVLCSSLNKQYISTWDSSGVTRNTDRVNAVIENVEWFEGPHGTVKVVPHRALSIYSDNGTDSYDGVTGEAVTDFSFVFQPSMIVKGTLKGYDWQSEDKAQDGLMYKRDVYFQGSVKSDNAATIGCFDFAGWATHTNTLGLPTAAANYDAT